MVSGLVTSPWDQLRIFSGEAKLMRMASKSAMVFCISNGLERNKVLLRFLLSSGTGYRVRTEYRSFCVPRVESCHARNASSSNLPKSAPSLEVSLPARYSVLGTRYWVLPLVCCRAGRGLFLPGLDQLYVEAERLQFADQHVERFRHARLHGSFALDDGLVNLGAAVNVVGLRRQQLLQNEGRPVSFERPDFHFSKALSAELRLAAQWLLGDQRVGSDGTRVNLVVHQMRQLQHVDVADAHRLFELVAGHAVVQRRLA